METFLDINGNISKFIEVIDNMSITLKTDEGKIVLPIKEVVKRKVVIKE